MQNHSFPYSSVFRRKFTVLSEGRKFCCLVNDVNCPGELCGRVCGRNTALNLERHPLTNVLEVHVLSSPLSVWCNGAHRVAAALSSPPVAALTILITFLIITTFLCPYLAPSHLHLKSPEGGPGRTCLRRETCYR